MFFEGIERALRVQGEGFVSFYHFLEGCLESRVWGERFVGRLQDI